MIAFGSNYLEARSMPVPECTNFRILVRFGKINNPRTNNAVVYQTLFVFNLLKLNNQEIVGVSRIRIHRLL